MKLGEAIYKAQAETAEAETGGASRSRGRSTRTSSMPSSRTSTTRSAADAHRTWRPRPVAGGPSSCRERGPEWQSATTTMCWASPAAHRPTRSRRPIAARPRNCIPTATRTPQRRGAVQGGQRGLRRAEGPRPQGRLRPLRPRRLRERHGGGGPRGPRGGMHPGAISPRPSPTCSTISSATSWAAGAAVARQRASRGSDLRYNLRVTLEEAYSGSQKSIRVPTLGGLRGLQAAPAPRAAPSR
jgi:hypothetical protein